MHFYVRTGDVFILGRIQNGLGIVRVHQILIPFKALHKVQLLHPHLSERADLHAQQEKHWHHDPK